MNIHNIILFSDFAYPYGGAGKVAFDSAIAFAQKGYNVIFFSGTAPESELLMNNGIKSICLHQPDMLSDRNRLNAAIRSIWNHKAYCATKKILLEFDNKDTLIIVHGYAKTLSTSIFAAFKKTKFKVFVVLHDYFAACPNGGFYIYPEHKNCLIVPLSLKCVTCNCDARSYSQKIYRCLRQLFIKHNLQGNKKYLHAINVSDLSGRIMAPYIKDYFASYSTLQNPIDVYTGKYVDITKNNKYIFVGRLSQEKGIRDFCRVITELQLEGVVLGDGYLLSELKEAYPNIVFAGWADKVKKEIFVKKSKCLIFPSLVHETFGLTIAEMLSYGIPCIIPDGCGASSLVNDGVNGYVYNMGDYNALKTCVEKFEACDLEQIQTNTRNSFVRENYSLNVYIERLLTLADSY